jgi:hypothetical protein
MVRNVSALAVRIDWIAGRKVMVPVGVMPRDAGLMQVPVMLVAGEYPNTPERPVMDEAAASVALVPGAEAKSWTICPAPTIGPATETVGVRTTPAAQLFGLDGSFRSNAASVPAAAPHPLAPNCETGELGSGLIETVTGPLVGESPVFITRKGMEADGIPRVTLPKSRPVIGFNTVSTVPSRTLPIMPALTVSVAAPVTPTERLPGWNTGAAVVPGTNFTHTPQAEPAARPAPFVHGVVVVPAGSATVVKLVFVKFTASVIAPVKVFVIVNPWVGIVVYSAAVVRRPAEDGVPIKLAKFGVMMTLSLPLLAGSSP